MTTSILNRPTQARSGDTRQATTAEAGEHAQRLAAKKSAKKKPKKLPVCTKKDLKTKKSKRRKCRVVAVPVRSVGSRPSPTGPVAAPPVTTPSVDAFPTAPTAALTDGLRTYTGTFATEQAHRLLYRAGFGPKPGQAAALAAGGLTAAVQALMQPASATLSGPAPTGNYLVGGALAPGDRWGHLHLSMMDRQIRSTDQLGERMTLVLHDWFAVSEGSVQGNLMPPHLDLLRRGWRGSFRQLLLDITPDPAMLQFLNGVENRRGSPNENYAREVMELFALGADRGAYTETDVREMARALTGFRNDWSQTDGAVNFRYDPTYHDTGTKTVFAGTAHERTGRLSWQDAINAVVDHPLHPSFVVRKLWSYFIPTEPTPVTQGQLEALYRRSGEQLGPLVEAILLHPDLHQGPSMVKSPAVFAAGLLRSVGQGLTTDAWIWRMDGAGQYLGNPPNVAGWNDRAWLNTSSHAARWGIVQEVLIPAVVQSSSYAGKTESSADAVERALQFWGQPPLTGEQLTAVRRVAQQTWSSNTPGDQYGSMATFLANRQNILRHLVAAAPDFQVS